MSVADCGVKSSDASAKTIYPYFDKPPSMSLYIVEETPSSKCRQRSRGKDEREGLLQEAQLSVHIPPNAIKADLTIHWNKMRKISRYRVQGLLQLVPASLRL